MTWLMEASNLILLHLFCRVVFELVTLLYRSNQSHERQPPGNKNIHHPKKRRKKIEEDEFSRAATILKHSKLR